MSFKKLTDKLLSACPHNSVFAVNVYYNENHSQSGTQLIKRFYSYDFAMERQLPIHGKPLDEYNGYKYILNFLRKLEMGFVQKNKDGSETTHPPGRLWSAIIVWNRFYDQNDLTADGRAKNIFIENVLGTHPKKFTTYEEQQRLLREEAMRNSPR
jgi:hypothetical protein